ncbi:MAG TPA: hypothetical protein VMR52_13395, partial [Dehalococcoidia bacterium]|nr:hypothetical protein [Dehalococcoidia bacterium]
MSVFLITILLSLFRGWNEKVGSFVEDSDVDVWVAAVGTNDFLAAASVMPLEDAVLLDDVITIEEWSPIIVRPMGAVGVEVDDAGTASGETDIDIHLIGYDAETGMSG